MEKLSKVLQYRIEHALPIELDSDEKGYFQKAHAAAALEVSEKTLERAAQKGKIKQIEKYDGKRKKVFYSIDDLEEFEKSMKTETHKGIVTDLVRQTPTNETALAVNEQVLNVFGAMFEQINSKLDTAPRLSPLAQITGKMFLDLEDAAKVSGIGKTKIQKAIHAAENRGELQRFSGERGKAVWKCEDLQKIIESIPPTIITKRLPPPKKKKE